MKISSTKVNLERALTIAERFTGKNITLPVLGNVLLEVSNKTLVVTATNLEHAVQIKIQGAEAQEGKVSVPARVLSSAIQAFKDEKVILEAKKGNLFVKTATQEIKVNGTEAEDFPLLPKIKTTASFFVGGEKIQRGVESVLPAVSFSEFKPELSGIFFKVSSKQLTLAATDTFRLSEKTMGLDKTADNVFSFILPRRVAEEIVRITRPDDEVKISYGENQALIEIEGIKIISRLIEGAFPDYASVIPTKFKTTAFVPREELSRILRASSIFASKLQDVTLSFKEKSVEVRSQNPDVGEYKTALSAAVSGENMTINFNYRYFLDGLSVTSDEEVFIGLGGENAPALLRNKSDETFLYIVMPIRLT